MVTHERIAPLIALWSILVSNCVQYSWRICSHVSIRHFSCSGQLRSFNVVGNALVRIVLKTTMYITLKALFHPSQMLAHCEWFHSITMLDSLPLLDANTCNELASWFSVEKKRAFDLNSVTIEVKFKLSWYKP